MKPPTSPMQRLSLCAAVLWGMGWFITLAPLLAADPFSEALSAWKTQYNEAVRKAERTASAAGPDAAAELRFRLSGIGQKLNQLEHLASTLQDLQSQIDSLESRENFLKNDWESAQRQYEWFLKQYQEKMAQLKGEMDAWARLRDQHNASQPDPKDKAAVEAYNAEAERGNAYRDQLRSRKQELINREGKQVEEAQQIAQKKGKEYEENKTKLEALKKQQGPQAQKFQALLAEASGDLARLPQGLKVGTVRRQVTELAAPRPAPSPTSRPSLSFVPLTPFQRGSPANPPLLPRDSGEGVRAGTNTRAMDQLKSAAAHGAEAKSSALQGAKDPLKLEEASQRGRRVFDTPGQYAGSLDPMVVDGREYSARDPVVPKEKRTPAITTLEKKRDEVKQEVQKLEKKVDELERLPRTPERDVEIVKAREQEDQAKNKMRFQNFMIQIALDEAPSVPAATKGSLTVPPPAPTGPNAGGKSGP